MMKSRILVFFAILIIAVLIISNNGLTQDCFESVIVSPTPFMGNNGEIFKLDDGSMWEIKYEYEYLYEYYPSVIVCPSRGKVFINDKSLDIELVYSTEQKQSDPKSELQISGTWELYEETYLTGTISGIVKKGRVFKTISGSIYEVTGVTIQVVVEVQPEVTVLRNGDIYKLVIEGFDEPLICQKLK